MWLDRLPRAAPLPHVRQRVAELHAFNRASFGTPQSLGCVELPLAAARKVWPYTPIGTLVTVEN